MSQIIKKKLKLTHQINSWYAERIGGGGIERHKHCVVSLVFERFNIVEMGEPLTTGTKKCNRYIYIVLIEILPNERNEPNECKSWVNFKVVARDLLKKIITVELVLCDFAPDIWICKVYTKMIGTLWSLYHFPFRSEFSGWYWHFSELIHWAGGNLRWTKNLEIIFVF